MSTAETLVVPAGYTCEWVNKEKVNAQSRTEYSKVLHLKKSAAVGDIVTVDLVDSFCYELVGEIVEEGEAE